MVDFGSKVDMIIPEDGYMCFFLLRCKNKINKINNFSIAGKLIKKIYFEVLSSKNPHLLKQKLSTS